MAAGDQWKCSDVCKSNNQLNTHRDMKRENKLLTAKTIEKDGLLRNQKFSGNVAVSSFGNCIFQNVRQDRTNTRSNLALSSRLQENPKIQQ